MHQFDYKRLVWLLTVALAVLGVFLSLFGGWLAQAPGGHVDWLEIIFRTMRLFKLDDHPIPEGNPLLEWARVLAPLATFSVIIQFIFEFFGTQISRWSIRQSRDHIVVCGLGKKGRAFIENIRRGADRSANVVAIERDPSDAQVSFCRQQGVRLLRADCASEATHIDAAMHRASYVVIATGSDDVNLRTATHLCETIKSRHNDVPLRVLTSIENPALWSELSNSGALRRLWDRAELIPFSLPLLAARKFFWDHPLYTYADLRGQGRIHLVFIGFGPYAVSVLIQMLRACLFRDFKTPKVTVLTDDAARERAIFERRFGALLKVEPQIGSVLEIEFLGFDLARDALDAALMGRIEEGAGVSGVVIEQESAEGALAVTLRVQDAMARTALWRAPIFVRSDTQGLSARLFTPEGKTAKLEQLIAPFGAMNELCDIALIEGDLERFAQRVHARYQATRAGIIDPPSPQSRAASAKDWASLPETYRQANRRAADHLKAKLASAGLYVPPGFALRAPRSVELADVLCEKLSKLEHEVWCADRRIDGWVPRGWRDDARKFHDNLVSYDALPEAVRNYDRDQIRMVFKDMLERVEGKSSDPALVRNDHWIGLIGANALDAQQAEWIAQTLCADILPRLVARDPEALFTLVTPLAPGSDMVMTQAALAFFAQNPHVHRLIVIEGVPQEAMLHDYITGWRSGQAWGGSQGESASLERIARQRAELVETSQISGLTRLRGWLIDLSHPMADYRADEAVRQTGYAKAGDYIAKRATTLIAACDPEGPLKAGGTRATLETRAKELLKPQDWPSALARGTITLDIQRRVIG